VSGILEGRTLLGTDLLNSSDRRAVMEFETTTKCILEPRTDFEAAAVLPNEIVAFHFEHTGKKQGITDRQVHLLVDQAAQIGRFPGNEIRVMELIEDPACLDEMNEDAGAISIVMKRRRKKLSWLEAIGIVNEHGSHNLDWCRSVGLALSQTNRVVCIEKTWIE
jgi:hypothetical protein